MTLSPSVCDCELSPLDALAQKGSRADIHGSRSVISFEWLRRNDDQSQAFAIIRHFQSGSRMHLKYPVANLPGHERN